MFGRASTTWRSFRRLPFHWYMAGTGPVSTRRRWSVDRSEFDEANRTRHLRSDHAEPVGQLVAVEGSESDVTVVRIIDQWFEEVPVASEPVHDVIVVEGKVGGSAVVAPMVFAQLATSCRSACSRMMCTSLVSESGRRLLPSFATCPVTEEVWSAGASVAQRV